MREKKSAPISNGNDQTQGQWCAVRAEALQPLNGCVISLFELDL
jgi:hypothetical protein